MASEQDDQEEEIEVIHEDPKSIKEYKDKSNENKLIAEVSRIQTRLENQVSLVEDLLLSEDRGMMDRELQTLDRVYADFVAAASNLREMASQKRMKKYLN